MTTQKKHDMENDRMEFVHLEKGRLCHHWKMKEKPPMENAQHRKCTPGKRQNVPPLENDRKSIPGKCMTWKMHYWKKVEYTASGKLQKRHTWKMHDMDNALHEKRQHGKCTPQKKVEFTPIRKGQKKHNRKMYNMENA